MSYVTVPFKTLSEFLAVKGFTQRPCRKPGAEIVMSHPVAKGGVNAHGLQVCIWTSVKDGQVDAAACGADAIRVTLVYFSPDGNSAGVAHATKVLRTGTVEKVLERLIDRAREMWQIGHDMSKKSHCLCGAPCYLDSGSCVDRHNPQHARNMAQASVARAQ
ncbi:MAG: hypothetical protein WC986_14590 [Elusimicrobiota bacterium]|jgi:hypothetical protein